MTGEGAEDGDRRTDTEFVFVDEPDESADTNPEEAEPSATGPGTEDGPLEGDGSDDHDTESTGPGTDLELPPAETDLELPPAETDLESGDRDGEERTKTDGPLGDLADRVRDREGDGEFDDLFDREDVGGIDREELWEQVEGTDDPLEDIGVEREIREIPKSTYCHQCEYFSSPPAVTCHNEETDILELVDLETFRVADCPVVLRNERLETD